MGLSAADDSHTGHTDVAPDELESSLFRLALRLALRTAWVAYASLGSGLVVLYYLLPTGDVAQALIFLAAPVGASIASARAARRAPASGRRVWFFLAIALGVASVSDGFYLGAPLLTGHWIKFPSVVDFVWLASYPFYLLAIWAMIRGKRDGD